MLGKRRQTKTSGGSSGMLVINVLFLEQGAGYRDVFSENSSLTLMTYE